ncbi:TIGR02588 family protein [Pseudaminobacter sp. NGMCC 1.201702]|uniref:TIGR02588 family protein n=1 Tax=Pseudaminobacter sp. NGMCC 1.201702 TaxID=3391825 RepID=UPI0039F0ED6D
MTKHPAKDNKEPEQQTDKGGATRKPGTSTTEWIVAGISCAVLLAVLGYLVVEGLSGRNGAAQLVVAPIEITATDGGYVVEFSVSNRAGKSVAAVEIKGELRDGDKVIEESGATLDYIPQDSERLGALIFRSDPKARELRLFASGYAEP